MARIRTIKPELPQSEKMGRISRDARLLFIQLFTLADDEGRARAASRLLASLLYPYDDDAKDLIPTWISELERENSIKLYSIDGNLYLQIVNWLEHQKIDRPSKSRLPGPEQDNSRAIAKPREASATDLVPSTLDLVSRTKKDSSAGPSKKGPTQEVMVLEPIVISIPTNRFDTIQEEVGYPQSKLDEWQATYAAVDVPKTLAAIRQWSIDAKGQRKTAKGMNKFINSWLAREQNRGGNRNEQQQGHRNPSHGGARNSRFLQGIGLGLEALNDPGPGEESSGGIVGSGDGRALLQR